MIHYEKNVATVLDVLAKHQYDERSLRLSQRCYDEFRHYMEDGDNTTFSQEAALKWCNSKVSKTYKNQFANAIQRLADVYAYGKVLKEHIKFFGTLSEAWSHDLNKYLQTLLLESNYSSNSQRDIKRICTQFCRFAQMAGVSSIQEVNYSFLEKYHLDIQSRYKSYPGVEGVVSKFLGYLADHNKCRKV